MFVHEPFWWCPSGTRIRSSACEFPELGVKLLRYFLKRMFHLLVMNGSPPSRRFILAMIRHGTSLRTSELPTAATTLWWSSRLPNRAGSSVPRALWRCRMEKILSPQILWGLLSSASWTGSDSAEPINIESRYLLSHSRNFTNVLNPATRCLNS